MNRDQMKKNLGKIVRLKPPVHWYDDAGYPLPATDDDQWRIARLEGNGARIENLRRPHFLLLPYDNVVEYLDDRLMQGVQHGFLVLKMQFSFRPDRIENTPTRPGEALPVKLPINQFRAALLSRLHQYPGHPVQPNEFDGIGAQAMTIEMVRCSKEELISARVVKRQQGPLSAVALGLRPAGVRWLRDNFPYAL